jgi:hypothetical protein
MNDPHFEEVRDKRSSETDRSEDRAYQRLEHLYAISKCLTKFESVEKTFLKILTILEGTFPVLSTVLVEKRGTAPHTSIWSTAGLNDEQVRTAITKARASFNYLVGLTPTEAARIESESVTATSIPQNKSTSPNTSGNEDHFIIIPLVVDRGLTFGVFQFEVTNPLNDDDVRLGVVTK